MINIYEELQEQFPPSADINEGYQWEYKTNEELDGEADSFMSSDVMSSMILAADKHHRDAKSFQPQGNKSFRFGASLPQQA